MKKLLIAGASGVNGTAVLEHFTSRTDWEVMTLSRTDEGATDDVEHIGVDLLDAEALRGVAGRFDGVTHLFYAALKPSDDAAVEADENARMFENMVNTLEASSPVFEHLLFLQGGKVYGAHLGVYKTPAREDDSRHFPPNLYFRQEDFCRRAAPASSWRYTALRPDVIIGHSVGSAMNLGNLIGVYGSLCRHLGLAMQFPGPAAACENLVNVTDADLMAESAAWAIDGKHTGAYNITNGDVFRWKHAWPGIADWFGCATGEPQPIELQARLESQSAVWREMVEQYGLEPHDVLDLGQGTFGDFIFHVTTDAIFDVTKARQAGFAGMHRRSIDSLLGHLGRMRERKLIPAFD